MFKRVAAISFILIVTSIAWMILSISVWSRTDAASVKTDAGMASIWGTSHLQTQPSISGIPASKTQGPDGSEKTLPGIPGISVSKSRVNVNLSLEYRRKGLLWYGVYFVDFDGRYTFKNPNEKATSLPFAFPFPSSRALYDNLVIELDGQPQQFASGKESATFQISLAPSQTSVIHVTYRSQGLESWRYNLGEGVTQTTDFELHVKTNFKDIDFPADTLSPQTKRETADGWDITWRYRSLVSGFQLGIQMPQKLQPGPLAGQISSFAPISLLLFFFVLFILTTIRKVDLHPMNYFFLAAAFFSFHLLLAYLVDHIAIEWAFPICSLVSVGLVTSYLRLVVGARFAVLEAGIAQLLYLVLFSYTFFLKGFTGLSITLGCIITLFLAMQVTGRTKWSEFSKPTVQASA